MTKRSAAQRERQLYRGESGRYAEYNPCYRCGKSAGEGYFSYKCDEDDENGNHWGDKALCLCHRCADYMERLGARDSQLAWAEAQSGDWGKLPQGKSPNSVVKVVRKTKSGAGWYYSASAGHFGGFFWSDELPKDRNTQSWGPFATFVEAKKDAVNYFQTDIDGARRVIKEIRSTRKPSKGSNQ